ncbi:hypothetical protein HS088_TW06G00122 [Tripterygium wilfordii]|uniref:Uncharacterized protein n=1 Tax=Tripterygium wilfordii TaxID=458696 RepID=A0A7J7DHX8_TRIWF|nr:hypothetical protein HS088_TW06G00122 [Tripterygium wilfordii]
MNFLFGNKSLPLMYQSRGSCYRVVASLFSTQTLTLPLKEKLCDRIDLIRDPKVSILPVLDQWVTEGNSVERKELRTFNDSGRHNHSLEVPKSNAFFISS